MNYERRRAPAPLLEGEAGQTPGAEQLANTAGHIRQELMQLVNSGRMPNGFDLSTALSDMEFVSLLLKYPAEAAIRIYAAEQHARNCSREAMQLLVEQLRTRQAMPVPMRTNLSAAPERNYMAMSPETFAAIERQYRKAAEQGLKVTL